MRNSLAISVLLFIASAMAACSGGNSPAAPSNGTNPGAPAAGPGGATITGSVQSGSSSTLATHGGASITGVTVTVAGTSNSATVDASGRFTLTNVPPGDVQLQFTGAANATLPVGAVAATETVDLVILVSGGSASIDSEVRNGAAEAQLEGRIDSLPPATPPLTFKAAGRTVKTDGSTQFVDGGATRSFADLTLGMRVHVKGTFAADVMTARWIELQSPQVGTPPPAPPTPAPPEDTSASIQGTLKTIGGSLPALTLLVDMTTVRTSSGTEVKRRGDVQTLDALTVGQSLHVVGTRRADASIDARLIEIDDDAVGGEFQIEGSLGGLKGVCPAVTFGVNGFSIATSASTSFVGSACSALKNGAKVTVKGTRLADGSVSATSVNQD
jgi:Domain of unknown function (DUF5666)